MRSDHFILLVSKISEGFRPTLRTARTPPEPRTVINPKATHPLSTMSILPSSRPRCPLSPWVCTSCLARLLPHPTRHRVRAAASSRTHARTVVLRGSLSDELYGSIAASHEDGPQLVPLDADSSEGLGGTSADAFGELVRFHGRLHTHDCSLGAGSVTECIDIGARWYCNLLTTALLVYCIQTISQAVVLIGFTEEEVTTFRSMMIAMEVRTAFASVTYLPAHCFLSDACPVLCDMTYFASSRNLHRATW